MKIQLDIDSHKIETEPGKTILETALKGGVYIPHLCYHPDLKPVGICGICQVEVDGTDEPVASCEAEAWDGMIVRTETPRIKALRLEAMARLLVNHPPECTDCSKYLNCELQSVRQYIGTADRLDGKRKHIASDYSNPLFVHDFVRCIKCGRCVRACNDLSGVGILQFSGEGDEKRVVVPDGKSLVEAGCRFCGLCVEVCPTGSMRDKEELVNGKKRREALLPCMFNCPAQINVPLYVRLIREGRYAEAVAVIREKVPFPETLGYICDSLCENACRRGEVNEPLSIRDLKRFAVENDREEIWRQYLGKRESTEKKVAVVGSGPAGLTAAFYLARFGHMVTIFESQPLAGGMMRYGIPTYRLPRKVLDREIQEIEAMGVRIKTNTSIESLDELISVEDFDAVLVATGVAKGKKLSIPGADLEDVYIGLDFLKRVHSGENVDLGPKVIVVGGGDVAFDCARVALRLGAKEVHIAFLEPIEAMLACKEEIERGKEEGILLHPSRTFTKIVDDNGQIQGIECLEIESFEFDENGFLEIQTVEHSQHILPGDTIVFAIGLYPEIPDEWGLDLDERGLIDIDPYTFESSIEGIYAVGDVMSGAGSVIEAIASGKRGAFAVDKFLGGSGEIEEKYTPTLNNPKIRLGPVQDFAEKKRVVPSCVPVDERIYSFCKIKKCYDEGQALSESNRCLQCNLRFNITPVKFWVAY